MLLSSFLQQSNVYPAQDIPEKKDYINIPSYNKFCFHQWFVQNFVLWTVSVSSKEEILLPSHLIFLIFYYFPRWVIVHNLVLRSTADSKVQILKWEGHKNKEIWSNPGMWQHLWQKSQKKWSFNINNIWYLSKQSQKIMFVLFRLSNGIKLQFTFQFTVVYNSTPSPLRSVMEAGEQLCSVNQPDVWGLSPP